MLCAIDCLFLVPASPSLSWSPRVFEDWVWILLYLVWFRDFEFEMIASPHVARALHLSTFWYLPNVLLCCAAPGPRFHSLFVKKHCVVQRRWIWSGAYHWFRGFLDCGYVPVHWQPWGTRYWRGRSHAWRRCVVWLPIQCLVFFVLLAPSLPSSCGSGRSRRVEILVPRVVMGASVGYFAVLPPLPPSAAGTPARFLVQAWSWRCSVGSWLLSLRSWGPWKIVLLSCIACLYGSAWLHGTSLTRTTVSSIWGPSRKISASLWMK